MSLDFNPSLNPIPESLSYSSANAVPAEFGKIGLPDASKAPELKGTITPASDQTIAKGLGLPYSPEVKSLADTFMRSVVKTL